MSELPKRLDRLLLRLDHMGLRVEQALTDALQAIRTGDVDAGREVVANDSVIDRQEVDIEKECIRLLALYQPAAIDLRRICFIIKVNSDLERIADLAASIATRVRVLGENQIDLGEYPMFDSVAEMASETLSRTVRMLSTAEVDTASAIILGDQKLDRAYSMFVRTVLDRERARADGVDVVFLLLTLGRALERIGDLCTNIAEDIIFLSTGEIVRHTGSGFDSDDDIPDTDG